MTNLISLLENKTITTQANISKPKHEISKLEKYAPSVVIPTAAIAGTLIGYDKFQKEKKLTEAEINKLKSEGVWGKEIEMKQKIEIAFKDNVIDLHQGYIRDMPNCLMIEGANPDFCDRMINWIGKSSGANFKRIKVGDDILKNLEKIEKEYQKNHKWTLLYVKNMDKLIDHSQSKDRIVEGMKDIMCASAEDYHTTIIFSTNNRKNLDYIALQPHRVNKIFNIDNISEKKFFSNIRAINSYNEKTEIIETAAKIKNKILMKYTAIGLAVGTAIYAGIKILLNKSEKKFLIKNSVQND